jgi:hypothetical protein
MWHRVQTGRPAVWMGGGSAMVLGRLYASIDVDFHMDGIDSDWVMD